MHQLRQPLWRQLRRRPGKPTRLLGEMRPCGLQRRESALEVERLCRRKKDNHAPSVIGIAIGVKTVGCRLQCGHSAGCQSASIPVVRLQDHPRNVPPHRLRGVEPGTRLFFGAIGYCGTGTPQWHRNSSGVDTCPLGLISNIPISSEIYHLPRPIFGEAKGYHCA